MRCSHESPLAAFSRTDESFFFSPRKARARTPSNAFPHSRISNLIAQDRRLRGFPLRPRGGGWRGSIADTMILSDSVKSKASAEVCLYECLQFQTVKPKRGPEHTLSTLACILRERFLALEKLDSFIVQHPQYQEAVMSVINLMAEMGLTLNHVNGLAAVEELDDYGSLRAPALEVMMGRSVDGLDRNDICKGIGYYRFNRIAAGTMCNCPNFNLTDTADVMFFMDPRVLLKHHFIACRGNAATYSSVDKCPGKLNSMMTPDEALKCALRAVQWLREMIQDGSDKVPHYNEIAVFKGVDSNFIYPRLAVLDGSNLLSKTSKYANRVFKVWPTTKRYEAGKQAMRASTLCDARTDGSHEYSACDPLNVAGKSVVAVCV